MSKTSMKAKQLASQLIPRYFKFFPSLSTDAFNAHMDCIDDGDLGVCILVLFTYVMSLIRFQCSELASCWNSSESIVLVDIRISEMKQDLVLMIFQRIDTFTCRGYAVLCSVDLYSLL